MKATLLLIWIIPVFLMAQNDSLSKSSKKWFKGFDMSFYVGSQTNILQKNTFLNEIYQNKYSLRGGVFYSPVSRP